MRALPGVVSAAITDRLPLYGGDNGTITLDGQPANHNYANSNAWVEVHGVTPGYFRTFAIPLLRGRRLTETDVNRVLARDNQITRLLGANASQGPKPGSAAARAMQAAVYPVDINQTMARMFWPRQNPLGKRFTYIGDAGMWLQVVGVVADTRQWGILTPPRPEAFQPWDGSQGLCLVLHTSLPPLELEEPARQALAGLDASLPLYQVRTMNQLVAEQTGQASFLSLLVGLFAALGRGACGRGDLWGDVVSGGAAAAGGGDSIGAGGRIAAICCGWCWGGDCGWRRRGLCWAASARWRRENGWRAFSTGCTTATRPRWRRPRRSCF